MEKRIYCKYCGAKLKKDLYGLVCPKTWTHNNDEKDEENS